MLPGTQWRIQRGGGGGGGEAEGKNGTICPLAPGGEKWLLKIARFVQILYVLFWFLPHQVPGSGSASFDQGHL